MARGFASRQEDERPQAREECRGGALLSSQWQAVPLGLMQSLVGGTAR